MNAIQSTPLYIFAMIHQLKQQAQYDSSPSYQEQREGDILKEGIWQKDQVLKFMVFCSFNLTILTSRFQRRTIKIFKEMSNFIGTRSSVQCRSQNQKFIKKHKNTKRILKAFEMQFGKPAFEEACSKHCDQLKKIESGRKKGNYLASPNVVSVLIQTQFLSSSQSNSSKKVKEQNQVQANMNYPNISFNPFPSLSQLRNVLS